MAKRSVESAWKLLVDGYLPFVRERAGRINPDLPDPAGTAPNPIPAIAMAVVSLDPRFEQAAALGVRSLQAPHPVDRHTAFPLASLSKPFASTTMALLAAEREGQPKEKRLAWSDDVPGLSIARTLSYANLFAHRSGLPDHAGDLLEDLGFDRDAILKRLGKLALNPIDRYAYTNFGLTAAAVRAAELAGEEWEIWPTGCSTESSTCTRPARASKRSVRARTAPGDIGGMAPAASLRRQSSAIPTRSRPRAGSRLRPTI